MKDRQPVIKVNVDKPDPPSERIQRRKPPFETFLDTYRKAHRPSGIRELWLRDRKKFAFAVIMLTLFLLWLLGYL